MAIAMVVGFPGSTEEQYAAAGEELHRSGTPTGELFHPGGPMDGCWRIVEGWASQAADDAFYGSAQFRQVTAALTSPTRTVWPIAYLERGSAWKNVP